METQRQQEDLVVKTCDRIGLAMRQQSKKPGNPFCTGAVRAHRMNRGITTVRIDMSGNCAN
jgi:hypothetical protein